MQYLTKGLEVNVRANLEKARPNVSYFFTDFRDLESPDDVIEEFSTSGLASAEIHKSKVRMSCNWIIF
jgi:hypothetical protein